MIELKLDEMGGRRLVVARHGDPHAVLGGSNLLHVVYANVTDQVVEHTTFNVSTNTWSCTNNVIGAIVIPSSASCTPGSSTHVMPSIGNGPRVRLGAPDRP